MILTAENYFSPEANAAYFSVSQVKRFMECEACAMAELSGTWEREKTTALMVGSYVDAHFSRELDLFRAKNPEIYTRTGSLRSEYQQAENIIGRIERDSLAMRMMGGDTQRIITGEIGGYPFKAKLDCWLDVEQCRDIVADFPEMADLMFVPGSIVDMKIMRDFSPMYRDGEGRLNFIEYWKYDFQMAIYQQLMTLLLDAQPPCYILAATKEKTTDIGLFQIPQNLMDAALEVNLEQMNHIAAVKRGEIAPERCDCCDYCKETKVLQHASWVEEWA